MRLATISTHNGSAVRREHNIRDKRVVEKQTHIKPDGVFEVWHDETLSKAYDRIFGKALKEFNAKQTRADRKINSYLAKVQNDSKKHACYEMIIGVYGGVDELVGKEVMREFVSTWQKRNPNLELIGAYYHADEEGEPHVHIDYVPVATGYKRGMTIQNGLDKALTQMGYSTKSINDTAQMQWEKRQNEYLETLCSMYGIEVEHPITKKQHLDTEQYKAEQELQKVSEKLSEAHRELLEVQSNKSIEETKINEIKAEIEDAVATLNKFEGKIEERKDGARLLRLIEEAEEQLKNRQPYSVEVVAEHEPKINPITKKQTKPATVEVTKESFDMYLQDKNLIQLLKELIRELLEIFKQIKEKLRKNIIREEVNQEFRNEINSLTHERNQLQFDLNLKKMENDSQQKDIKRLSNEKNTLKNTISDMQRNSSALIDRFPFVDRLQRICKYEEIYNNRKDLGHHSVNGRFYLPDVDGKEVHLWHFMEDYAKECKALNIEPLADISEHYANYHDGVDLMSSLNEYDFRELGQSR